MAHRSRDVLAAPEGILAHTPIHEPTPYGKAPSSGGYVGAALPPMRVFIPAKASPRAKARLADVLDGEARARLMEGLLEKCLTALLSASARSGLEVRLVVVSGDDMARAVALRYGASLAPDSGQGPNVAISAALSSVPAPGGVCILAADLPLLDEHGVLALLRAVGAGCLTIAPDRLGTGTNALGLPHADASFPFAFGPQSFARHVAAGVERGWRVDVVRCPGIGVDLDEPWDLDLARSPADARSANVPGGSSPPPGQQVFAPPSAPS